MPRARTLELRDGKNIFNLKVGNSVFGKIHVTVNLKDLKVQVAPELIKGKSFDLVII